MTDEQMDIIEQRVEAVSAYARHIALVYETMLRSIRHGRAHGSGSVGHEAIDDFATNNLLLLGEIVHEQEMAEGFDERWWKIFHAAWAAHE